MLVTPAFARISLQLVLCYIRKTFHSFVGVVLLKSSKFMQVLKEWQKNDGAQNEGVLILLLFPYLFKCSLSVNNFCLITFLNFGDGFVRVKVKYCILVSCSKALLIFHRGFLKWITLFWQCQCIIYCKKVFSQVKGKSRPPFFCFSQWIILPDMFKMFSVN